MEIEGMLGRRAKGSLSLQSRDASSACWAEHVHCGWPGFTEGVVHFHPNGVYSWLALTFSLSKVDLLMWSWETGHCVFCGASAPAHSATLSRCGPSGFRLLHFCWASRPIP